MSNPIQDVQHQYMIKFSENSFVENQLVCSQTKFSIQLSHEDRDSGTTCKTKSKKPKNTKLLLKNQ